MKTGKLAESALKRSVLKQIYRDKNGKCAAVGSDCAFFAVPDGRILAWCAQEAAVAEQADMGTAAYTVIKCANNLAAAGAVPVSALISLMLPESYEELEVKEIMKEIARACDGLGMEIAGGDTNISYAVTAPVLTVSAMGVLSPEQKKCPKKTLAGQDIVISKWIGLEGTALLAKARKEEILSRYPAYLVETAEAFDQYLSVLPEAGIAMENGVGAMHDLSQGGVFGALWELAEGCGLGLSVDLKKIPIRQETVEVCEVCNVNPYEMRSAGSLLMTSEDGPALADALQRAGISAAVIGKLTEGNERAIVNEGEKRFLDRPRGEDLIAQVLTAKKSK